MSTAKRRILVAEDDVKTAELVKLYLQKGGYDVYVAHDGSDALDVWRRKQPDLVVLDLMLPVMSGLDVCRIIRSESDSPIIMLTARATEDDKLRGLDLGADDYVTKPFSPRELVARVRTVLRRTAAGDPPPEPVSVGVLTLDFVRREVTLGAAPVRLTPKEFNLLATLAQPAGKAFSRAELLDKVFGYGFDVLDRTLDVHVMNLRKKIEADPARPIYIVTVYGFGYRLGTEPVPARAGAGDGMQSGEEHRNAV